VIDVERENTMMFLLLIEDGGAARTWAPGEYEQAIARMNRFTSELKTRGAYRASDKLHPDSEGARVQIRDGQPFVVNGPFAETKEVVGGFYLIDCADRAEAIAIASECPAASWGTVEVRQVRA
jgi:hypothetical protein